MTQQEHSGSWRDRLIAHLAWLSATFQNWRNPWLAGLWLSAAIVAVILSVVPGDWVSLTRRGLSSDLAYVIELLSHFLGYAVLVGLVSLACRSWTGLIVVYLAALFISVMLEIVQFLIPERGASFEDLAMNVLGASTGSLFGVARLRRNNRVSVGGQSR